MSDDMDDTIAKTGGSDNLAAGIALDASTAEEAREYLRNQNNIARLQVENLQKQDEYETSHLRWRRFNDQMKGAMQIMLVAAGALVVVVIGTAMWNASRADGLVVDAFTVPQSFETRGVSGDVIAGDVTEKVTTIRKAAMDISYSISSDVTAAHANDIKVDIPETGVSISEAWRYLRRWLGNERHLTGSLRELDDGRVVLSVSLDGGGAMTETGKSSDLPALEQKTAEDVFGAFDPVNHINYLALKGRTREALAAAERFVPASEGLLHVDSYALLSQQTAYATGDIALALARAGIGISLDPKFAVLHVMTARYDDFLGRDEAQLREDGDVLTLRNEDQLPAHQHGGFDEMKTEARAQIALLGGDFANATYWSCAHACTFTGLLVIRSVLVARLHDVATARALLAEGQAGLGADPNDVQKARHYIDVARGDWDAALDDVIGVHSDYASRGGDISPRFLEATYATGVAPLLAVAEAHAGQFARAHATIDRSPGDCVACETARGEIDALQQNRGGAAFWFARAVHDAPSIPFAYSEWGAMLLAKGDLDGAIAKFALANRKGPHFADPLEMWGEALIAKNRSDLALAKFEEANKYAPNWGRLHLKWGEALLWSGKPAEARKQFAIAAMLDLIPSEKVELRRMASHV